MTFSDDRRKMLLGTLASLCAPRVVRAARPLRVAALDWAITETMLAIGQPPIAIVGAGDWSRFVVEPSLPSGVADLGLAQELNLELLASLRPDLILTSPFLQNLEPAMQRIARPVRLTIFERTAAPLGRARTLTLEVGALVGREEAARQYLARADALLDQHRARLAALASPPPPLLLATFVDARHVRVYGGTGSFQNVLDRLGLRNAWTGTAGPWGLATVGIERLATDRAIRLVAFGPIPADVVPTLERSPLWSQLPFIQAGQLSVLPPVFMFGAMPSALRLARLLSAEMERTAE